MATDEQLDSDKRSSDERQPREDNDGSSDERQPGEDNGGPSDKKRPEEDNGGGSGSSDERRPGEDTVTELKNDSSIYVPQVSSNYEPYIGQRFNSIQDAREFYNLYAKEAGFSTRAHSNRKDENGTGYRWSQFTCSKQGTKNYRYQEKEKHKKPRTGERRRGITRCGCKASLTVKKDKNEDRWIISVFNVGHNHPLTSPRKVHLLNSHRNVTPAQKNLLSQLSEANISTAQTIRAMEIEYGGPSSIGCLEQDIRNHERDMRKEHLGHDAESLVAFFESQKRADPNYCYNIKTEGNVFNRCFWADSESRSAYAYFGDVVVFDTTYNTNKYGMIFAPFVGVNHHRHTVLFGCGFLSNETTDSFIWLFSQFLAAMPGGVVPKVIITDQDQAIGGAIAQVFPPTVHHLCLWHITNKFPEKLGPRLHSVYRDVLSDVVNRCETPAEFERKWGELMSTTPLGGSDWLRSMYGIRERWVPAYVRPFFAAGMSSSQRVESHHSFLKTYVVRKNSLVDFILRFNRAIEHQRHKEQMADHVDKDEVPATLSPFPFEAQMRDIYTKTMFLLFQDELMQAMFYDCKKVSSTFDTKVYQLVRFDKEPDRPRHVTWSTVDDIISCSCNQFQFDGYLCRHILCLMYRKGVRTLSDRYILPRWTKNAKSVPVFDPTPETIARLSSISARATMTGEFMELANEVSLEADVRDFVMRGIRDLARQAREMMAERIAPIANTERIIIPEDGVVEGGSIQDPLSVRAKGCGKRLRSSKEKSSKKCGECRQPGHTIRTCPRLHSRSGMVDVEYEQDVNFEAGHDYRPDTSFVMGDNGYIPTDDTLVSQPFDSYSVLQPDPFIG